MSKVVRRINEALAKEGSWFPDYDGDREAHPTHTGWAPGPRDSWTWCTSCYARSHWPAAEKPCPGPSRHGKSVELEDARAALLADVEAFFEWWEESTTLPSQEEWTANFFEWTKQR